MKKMHFGYYAHHAGSGHTSRAGAILRDWEYPATLLSSYSVAPKNIIGFDYVHLPEDHAHLGNYDQSLSPVSSCLHHAPLGVPDIRERMHIISDFFYNKNPALFISDVSAEMVQFARLCSVPSLAVRLTGHRDDPAHVQAFETCRAMLSPLAEIFESEKTSAAVRKKTFYTGGICRHRGKQMSKKAARESLRLNQNEFVVLVVNGLYGDGRGLSEIIALAQSDPQTTFMVLGKIKEINDELPQNVRLTGLVPDTFPYLRAADIVIGSCGNNTLLETAYAARPYICLPEERPYAEQTTKAAVLEKYNMAVVRGSFPRPEEWKEILEKVKGLDVRAFEKVIDPQAVEKTRAFLIETGRENFC